MEHAAAVRVFHRLADVDEPAEQPAEGQGPFARVALRRGAVAWGLALALAVAPIARFSLLSGGASLFQGH